MRLKVGASKWAENVGRQALLRFWGGRPSQPLPPRSGSLGDPPTLRRSGPRASRLALRPVQVPGGSSAPFGPCGFGKDFPIFILRWEFVSRFHFPWRLFRRYELSTEKFSQL